ncbi:MAG: hypothetical protein ACI4GW_00655, partial [Lachnospiraceae bacterium]
GEQYMHTWMREQHIREEAREEGAEQLLVDLITARVAQGNDISQIAKDLLQTKEYIEELIEKYHIDED